MYLRVDMIDNILTKVDKAKETVDYEISSAAGEADALVGASAIAFALVASVVSLIGEILGVLGLPSSMIPDVPNLDFNFLTGITSRLNSFNNEISEEIAWAKAIYGEIKKIEIDPYLAVYWEGDIYDAIQKAIDSTGINDKINEQLDIAHDQLYSIYDRMNTTVDNINRAKNEVISAFDDINALLTLIEDVLTTIFSLAMAVTALIAGFPPLEPFNWIAAKAGPALSTTNQISTIINDIQAKISSAQNSINSMMEGFLKKLRAYSLIVQERTAII